VVFDECLVSVEVRRAARSGAVRRVASPVIVADMCSSLERDEAAVLSSACRTSTVAHQVE
jgi:hypothetical protein